MHTSQLNPELDTSIEMKILLLLLALGYASSEKLDLTYLPPPGSQYAGGRPEDIQVPLEFPKDTYSTTLRPQVGDNRGLRPEDYKPTIGIDRVPGVQDVNIVSPGSSPNFQNTNKVPTTTVSYAFTQTTTHPPEGFETTIGPQITSNYPTTDIFNNFPSQEPGFEGQNVQNIPGYQQPINQFGQRPILPAGAGQNVVSTQQPGSVFDGNFNAQNQPGYQQITNQFGQPTLTPTSGPQFTGPQVPGYEPAGQQFVPQNRPGQQSFNQHQPGLQQPNTGNIGVVPTFEQNQYRNQSFPGQLGIGNHSSFVPSTVGPQYYPTNSVPSSPTFGDNASNIPGSITNIPGTGFSGQNIQPSFQPGANTQPGQVPIGQNQFGDKQIINQQFPGSQPADRFREGVNAPVAPFSTAAPVTPGFSTQQFPGTSVGPNYVNEGNVGGSQEYTANNQRPGVPTLGPNRLPSSTASPTYTPGFPARPEGSSISPGFRGQQYPTSPTPGAYSTPAYTNAEANAATSVYRQRPERPQADADRNAEILNYTNVITPEGFAYSFDTSNGIHADENGTAIDGVKAQGSYSYTGDDGKVYSVVYTADEDGFRPHGDHLPTPPPIPEAIQRVIEQAEREKEAGISHDGSYNENKYGHKKYQGAMGLHPQFSQKAISNAAIIPEDELTETMKKKIGQRIKVQPGQTGPITSIGETQYDEANYEPAQTSDQKPLGNENRRRPGVTSTQRPLNRVTDIDSEDNDDVSLEEEISQTQANIQGPTNRPFVQTSSKRPVNKPFRKQYNKVNGPGSDESVVRYSNGRRPIVKVTPSEATKYGQDTDEYVEGPEYNEQTNKGSFPKEGPLTPNEQEQEEKYVYANDELTDNYEGDSKRPAAPGSFRRPGLKTDAETEVPTGQQYYGKQRRPTSGKNRLENQPSQGSYNRQRIGSKRPSNKPFTQTDEFQTVPEDNVTDEDFGTKQSTKPHSGPVKAFNKFASREQNVPAGIRQRPGQSGVFAPATDRNVIYQPEEDEYIESDSYDNGQSQAYDNRRPVPSKGSEYEQTEQEFRDIDKNSYPTTPAVTVSGTKNIGSHRRPQVAQTIINNESVSESNGKRVSAQRPETQFTQKTQPGYSQQNGLNRNKVNVNRPFNASGYEYIPPQTKFEHDEVKVIPTRFRGTTRRPLTGNDAPTNDYYEDKNTSSKPFMTPNVSFITDRNEKHDEGIIVGKPQQTIPKTQNDQYDEDDYSQFSEDGTTPDQTYGEEDEISSTRPFDQFPSSTKRPVHQQATGRPTPFGQRVQNVPGLTNDRVTPKGRPSQGTKAPFGLVSSTTTMPSTELYGSTNIPTSTAQGDEAQYTDNGFYKKVPGQGSISQTTPFIDETPTIGGYYQEDTIGPQYQTTYGSTPTISPTTKYVDGTAQTLPTMGPTDAAVNIVPAVSKNRYQGNLPSTTYRPNVAVTTQYQPGSPAKPGAQIDNYGRPINVPGFGTTTQDFIPDINQVSSTARPGVDVYGRPVRPGFDTMAQEYIPGDQNVPSSTAAPGVLVDTFGRPIVRPGIGDGVQQYEPVGQQVPSSTARPGIQTDAYGRPITASGSTPAAYTPGYSTVPGSTIQGQPGINPALGDRFQPGYSTVPGSTIQGQLGVNPTLGDRFQGYQSTPVSDGQYQQNTSTPGSQYRGSQKYQPGYTQRPAFGQNTSPTFQSSTERIIGEDFSGPKQQQKFDPQTGYYYK